VGPLETVAGTPSAKAAPPPLPVIFTVPETFAPQIVAQLRTGHYQTLEAYGQDGTRRIGAGLLLSTASEIDANTGTLECHGGISVDQDLALLPNTFLHIRLLLEVKRGVIMVPARAIRRNPGGTMVYTIKPDETVGSRSVQIGAIERDDVEIREGLSIGDRVIVEPRETLVEGTRVHPTSAPPPAQTEPSRSSELPST
jgi:multidrug efflux system membrane fusion protein